MWFLYFLGFVWLVMVSLLFSLLSFFLFGFPCLFWGEYEGQMFREVANVSSQDLSILLPRLRCKDEKKVVIAILSDHLTVLCFTLSCQYHLIGVQLNLREPTCIRSVRGCDSPSRRKRPTMTLTSF